MEDKITIIEGPPPTFEMTSEEWILGLNDSPTMAGLVSTRLRTFNGPALVERCHKAWRDGKEISLEFRASDGLEQEAQIVAARSVDSDEGHVLVLWLRLPQEQVELEIGYEDDSDDDDDDEFGLDIDLLS
jgi:hypothetical protein